MIRLTLLQSRTQTLVVLAMLAVMAIVVVPTGLHLTHLYDTTVVGCDARGDCDTATHVFMDTFSLLHTTLNDFALIVPAVIGIFFGAPVLAREFEAGTFRLAWTQGVSRRRWFAVKLVCVVLAGMIAAGLLSLMVTWWSSPFDSVSMNRFDPGQFDVRGLAPIGYGALAVAVGALAGLVTRRMLPAMAVTLVVFVAVRLVIAIWVLPFAESPAHLNQPLQDGGRLGFDQTSAGQTLSVDPASIPNAWIISSRIVDSSGQPASNEALYQFLVANCQAMLAAQNSPDAPIAVVKPGAPETLAQAFRECIAQFSTEFHISVTYQPAKRYWPFQWIDTAIYVGLSIALAGLGYWWLRRRVA